MIVFGKAFVDEDDCRFYSYDEDEEIVSPSPIKEVPRKKLRRGRVPEIRKVDSTRGRGQFSKFPATRSLMLDTVPDTGDGIRKESTWKGSPAEGGSSSPLSGTYSVQSSKGSSFVCPRIRHSTNENKTDQILPIHRIESSLAAPEVADIASSGLELTHLADIDALPSSLKNSVQGYSRETGSDSVADATSLGHFLTTISSSSSTGGRLSPSRGNPSAYKFVNLVGEGAIGRVYEAVKINTGERVAIKVVRKSRLVHSSMLCKLVRDEVRILTIPAIVQNPFIIRLLSSFQDEAHLYYVFEWVSGGTLAKTIEHLSAVRPQCPVVPIELVRLWISQLLSAVWTMSHDTIVHRDIKPENILIADDGNLKLTDFNSAVIVPRESSKTSAIYAMNRVQSERDFTGTLPWWSPERISLLLSRSPSMSRTPPLVSQSSTQWQDRICPGVEFDLWAVGCVMYEMLTGKHPFMRSTPESTSDAIMKYANRPSSLEFPANLGPITRDLCRKLLEPNPLKRAEMIPENYAELTDHLFFSSQAGSANNFDPGELLKSILSSPRSECLSRFLTSSALEFTPEPGHAFHGRDIDQDLESPKIRTCHKVGTFKLQDNRSPIRPNTPFSWKNSSQSSTRLASGTLRDVHTTSPNDLARPIDLGGHDELSGPDARVKASSFEKIVSSRHSAKSSFLICQEEDSGNADEFIYQANEDRLDTDSKLSREIVSTPDKAETCKTSAEASWAAEMCTSGFRDLMIPHIVHGLQGFFPEALDFDVVEAAEVLTWGPLRVSSQKMKPKTAPLCCLTKPSVFYWLRRLVFGNLGADQMDWVVCFGVLSKRFGILLFSADIADGKLLDVVDLPKKDYGLTVRRDWGQRWIILTGPKSAIRLDVGSQASLEAWLPALTAALDRYG